MEFPARYVEKSVGRLELVERSGGFLCRMTAEKRPEGVFRGVLVGTGGEIPLGVLEPVENTMTLARCLTRGEVLSIGRILGGEVRLAYRFLQESDWKPLAPGEKAVENPRFAARLQEIPGVQVRTRRGLRWVAVPFHHRKPFPLAELFCFAAVEQIGGGLFAVFAFSREGRPVMTEKSRRD